MVILGSMVNNSWLRGSLGERLALRWLARESPPVQSIDIFAALKKARKILVAPNDRVGGLFIGASVCKAMRQAYPASQILLLVDERRASIARQIPFVDRVLTLPLDRPIWSSAFAELSRQLRQEELDLVLCLGVDCSFRLAWFCRRCGARLGVGFRREGLPLFNVEIVPEETVRYEGEYCAEILRYLGLEEGDEVRWVPAPEMARKLRSRYLEEIPGTSRVVGVDLAKGEGHGFTRRQFDEIVGRIVERGVRALLFFTLAEKKQVRYLQEVYGRRIILFAQDDLAGAAALLQGCKALIAGNTELLHLAISLRVPVVGVFDGDAQRWIAPGNPLVERVQVQDMRAVDVTQIVQALEPALRGR